MRTLILAFAVLAVSLGAAFPSFAAPSAADVVREARIFGTEERYELFVTMRIEEGVESKERRISVAADQRDGDAALLIRVVEPGFLANLKYLRLKKQGGPIQQWLKTSRGVSRVAGSGSGERLFGSHFTAEDFVEIDPAGFDLGIVPGDAPLVVRAVPRGPGYSYARKDIGIDTETGLIVSVAYYDAAGRLLRAYSLEEIASIGGKAYPRRAIMSGADGVGRTILIIETIDAAVTFPARLFNPANL